MAFTGILIGLILAIAFSWVWKTYNMNEKVAKTLKRFFGVGGELPPDDDEDN